MELPSRRRRRGTTVGMDESELTLSRAVEELRKPEQSPSKMYLLPQPLKVAQSATFRNC